MNPCPVSGPMTSNSSHHDRADNSSRNSLAKSKTLRESKENILQATLAVCRQSRSYAQLIQCAFAGDAAIAQQHQTVTNTGCIDELMNREHQRSPALDLRA